MSKRPALGKGMSALISGGYDAADESVRNRGQVSEVDINLIKGNPDQPRKIFNPEGLEELASSIREKGVLQPILVAREGNEYQIIAGERRFRASKIAGLASVPVIIREFTDNEKLEIALIENLQREDLNPIEEANAYKELMEKANLNQEDVAVKVGKNRSTVANSLRLLKLPAAVQKSLEAGDISAGHARAILSLNTEQQMSELHKRILAEGFSVREAEAFSVDSSSVKAGGKANKKRTPEPADPQLREIQEKFIDKFGTKVNIIGDLNGGKVEISYYSMEDLDRLYEVINK